MDGITEDASGLSYDFGVNIARGVVSSLATVALKIGTITGAIYAIIDAGKEQDAMFKRHQLAMGGYNNLLQATEMFSKKIAAGVLGFPVEDLIQGTRELNRAGIDVKDNMELINKAAKGMNMNFSELSSIIRSGDYSALANAGLITDRMALNAQRTTLTQEQGTKRVLALLKKADREKLFEGQISSMSSIALRLKEIWKRFITSIIGDPKDPDGLWNQIKKQMSDFATFFHTKMEKLQKIGQVIGKVLSFTIKIIRDFTTWAYRSITKTIRIQDSFWKNWEEKMYSLGLFLEIMRVRFKAWLEGWGGVVIKILAATWALNRFSSVLFFLTGITSMKRLHRVFDILLAGKGNLLGKVAFNRTWIGKLFKWVTKLGPALSALGASLMGASAAVLWPLAIIAAIIVGIYLLVKYWDEIRTHANGTNDALIGAMLLISPMGGLILGIAKYWNQVKTSAQNIYAIITNLIDITVSLGTIIYRNVEAKFKSAFTFLKGIIGKVDSWFEKHFGKAYRAVKKVFLKPLQDAFDKIKEWWKDFSFGGVFDKIGGWLEKFANTTKNTADGLANEAGRNSFSKGGTSYEDVQTDDVKNLIKKGKSDEQILKIVGAEKIDLAKIQDIRGGVERGNQLQPNIPTVSPGSPAGSTEVRQENNFNIMVSRDVDVNKVVEAVNNVNTRREAITNRREGK